MMWVKLFALILIVAVAAVLIAPAVNLEPTALRSARSLVLLFALMTTLVATLMLRLSTFYQTSSEAENPSVTTTPIVDLVCARLC